MSGAGSVMVSDVGLVLGPDDEARSRSQRDAAPESEASAPKEARPAPAGGYGGEARLVRADPPSASTADPGRLREMMRAHFNFIWRSLQRLGVPPADVDDCAQQVFLVASRKIETIALGSEQAFLFGTALNVAAEARRSQARRRDTTTFDTFDTLDTAPRPDELLDRARARELLDKVLAAMPMDLRAAFVLYELEEMPIHMIATFLNIPTGTAASRL